MVLFLLAIRGVPSLIFAQSQVSAPLNSQPVKGGATPIQSPAQSGGYIVLHMDLLLGLYVGYVKSTLSLSFNCIPVN